MVEKDIVKIIEEELRGYLEKLIRKTKRAEERIENLKEISNLSVHGYWDLGYFTGRVTAIDEVYDQINNILNLIKAPKIIT